MLYSDLYSAVQNYTEYAETTFLANIPFFVQLAEEDIYRKADLPLQSKVATGTLVAGTNTLTLPSDYLNMEYFLVQDLSGNQNPLLNKEIDYIYQVWGFVGSGGIPQHYNQRDSYTLVFGPTPDQNYPYQFQYNYVPVSLVNSGSSPTWLSTNAQNALLYGTLVQAYIYMKGEDSLLETYKALYMNALMDAKLLGEGLDRSDEYRNPPPRNLPQGSP